MTTPDKTDDLLFLKILQEAFEQEDTRQSVRQAVAQIKARASEASFARGYDNFRAFAETIESMMTRDSNLSQTLHDSLVHDCLLSFLTDDAEGTNLDEDYLLSIIAENPDLQQLKDEISSLITEDLEPEIEVLRNGELLASTVCTEGSMPILVPGLTPGEYTVQLSNGRVLLSKRLESRDLRWKQAFPDKEYPAAAMTELTEGTATHSVSLLGNWLILEIYPGIESGILRIRLIGTDYE
jgi:hypothetical protein